MVTTDNTDSVTLAVASGPGSFTAGSTTTATVHNGVATFNNLTLVVPGSYTLSAVVPALYTGPNSTSFTIAPLQVVPSSFASSPSGFSLSFNAPFLVNATTPVLYGPGFGPTAPVPSVTLTGPSGPVEGSVVLNTATNSLTFVATNTASFQGTNGTPILPDGTYTVDLLSSGPTGFQALNSGGGYLDGLGNGTPGSGDYTTTFTVGAAAAGDDVVWVPATADRAGRAPGSPRPQPERRRLSDVPLWQQRGGDQRLRDLDVQPGLSHRHERQRRPGLHGQRDLARHGHVYLQRPGGGGRQHAPRLPQLGRSPESPESHFFAGERGHPDRRHDLLLRNHQHQRFAGVAGLGAVQHHHPCGHQPIRCTHLAPGSRRHGLQAVSHHHRPRAVSRDFGANSLLTTISGGATTTFTDTGSATTAGTPPSTTGFSTATVPNGTPASPLTIYKAKDLLQVSATLNGGSVPSVGDSALHLVAFVGDADGNGVYSSGDAVAITRVALSTDTGFTAYPLVDPTIVADTDGDGFIPTDAALQVNELGVGFPAFSVAPVPNSVHVSPGDLNTSGTPPGPTVFPIGNGLDPTLTLPSNLQVGPDGTVVVPVNIDDPRPAGSTGLIEAHLALTYNPSLFTVSAADVHAGSVLAGGDWSVVPTIDQATGQIGIALSSSTPISVGDRRQPGDHRLPSARRAGGVSPLVLRARLSSRWSRP